MPRVKEDPIGLFTFEVLGKGKIFHKKLKLLFKP